MIGSLIGFVDSNRAGSGEWQAPAYFVAGALLGLRHARRSCPCWPILGFSLYAVHVIAIACGRKPPYVEENYRFAEQCLWVVIPSGFGVMVGAGVRVVLAVLGWFRRVFGPPVRFLPGSMRGIILVVACIGLGLGCVHRVIFPPTIYARGYDEARFQSICEGMTGDQVISALGAPLEKRPWTDGQECWEYSAQYTYTSDYHRRWIFMQNGRVRSVVNDYWFD